MDDQITRRRLLAAFGAGGAAGLAGCLNLGNDKTTDGAPALRDQSLFVDDSFEYLRENVVSGGVQKDGIPSIDDPSFIDASEYDGDARDDEIVFGVARNGIVKAYPRRILAHHEIVKQRSSLACVETTTSL